MKAIRSSKTQTSSLVGNLDIILLLALMAVMFFYNLGGYPLFDLDEPRYAEAAREMLENGNWITPYFNYELRFDKPVFFYWLVAGAYQLFGVSEFAARFSSAVAASAIVGMVYAFGRYWVSRQYAFFAALILATSVLFVGIARMSITDMTLTCFMTGTTLCLFMAAHHHLRWWLVAGVFSGLAVLTKGPVGIVVPGAIFTIYAFAIGDLKRCLINRWLPMALLVCMAIALPWYILAYQQNGPIFLEALFLHNVTRFSDVVSGHQQPIYFFVIVLLAGFLPWTAYLPAVFKRLQVQGKTHRTRVQNQDYRYLVSLYSMVWTIFIFTFFTLGNTKLLTYILPLFPALALLLAEVWLARIEQSDTESVPSWKWFSLPAWGLVVVAAVAGTLFVTRMEALLPREAAGIQANSYNLIAVVCMVVGTLLTAGLIQRKNMAYALLSQVVTMTLVLVVAMQGIVPNVSKAAQGVMMDYLSKAGDSPIVLYEIQRPSLTFYGQRRIPRFVEEDGRALRQELNKNKQTYVITKNVHLPDFNRVITPAFQVQILENDPVYSLLSVSQAP